MSQASKPRAAGSQLTRREREIMNAIFALGNKATADEIRARLHDAPGDSSVRVMLARLEKKGIVKHQQDGIRYLYSATLSPARAKRTALQDYLHTFFGGSLKHLVTALISEEEWTDEELAGLRNEIDLARRERKNDDKRNPR
jgi:BlaI family transcriptional regulator, penicillinase repressor